MEIFQVFVTMFSKSSTADLWERVKRRNIDFNSFPHTRNIYASFDFQNILAQMVNFFMRTSVSKCIIKLN